MSSQACFKQFVRSIFLFVGLITVVTVPFVYWKMDNNIALARFISDEDKPKAVERLRANHTGTGTSKSCFCYSASTMHNILMRR
jgi:hypothetical protein